MTIHDNDSKKIVWLSGEIKTPPLSVFARIEAGFLLRQLQEDELLSMPVSRPMPDIGKHCHELRVRDSENNQQWRIIYRIDDDAIIVASVFLKKTQETPRQEIDNSQNRLKLYDKDSKTG